MHSSKQGPQSRSFSCMLPYHSAQAIVAACCELRVLPDHATPELPLWRTSNLHGVLRFVAVAWLSCCEF